MTARRLTRTVRFLVLSAIMTSRLFDLCICCYRRIVHRIVASRNRALNAMRA